MAKYILGFEKSVQTSLPVNTFLGHAHIKMSAYMCVSISKSKVFDESQINLHETPEFEQCSGHAYNVIATLCT